MKTVMLNPMFILLISFAAPLIIFPEFLLWTHSICLVLSGIAWYKIYKITGKVFWDITDTSDRNMELKIAKWKLLFVASGMLMSWELFEMMGFICQRN